MDYTIRTDFPHLDKPAPAVYIAWFKEVSQKTAEMIVHWMRVGFVHGVMNTDNMSILGLTIDYGPYGWLEDYNPDWTPNITDASGRRYRFGHQPQIAQWNLFQLANAIYPLLDHVKHSQEALLDALNGYSETYTKGWQTMMAQKLGLNEFDPKSDGELIADLLAILQLVETDMTIFYRKLAMIDVSVDNSNNASDEDLMALLIEAYYNPEQLTDAYKARIGNWIRRNKTRVKKDGTPNDRRCNQMNAVNPKYVFRNNLAQLAIDKAEQGDNSLINELLKLLRHPYDEQPDKEKFARKRPDWARQRAGCSMLSCSS